ncbi:hypothetical protein MNB_SV-6-1218 [hydrothermal vent metagenome]|uniref:Uncharacterized protein n=1 Tax=hydrothermal vent metagenome TaxID=652676 RepID=A0A1W1C1Q2_9ZZZZ
MIAGCDMDIFNDKEIMKLKEENRKLQLAKLKLEANRSLVLDEKQLAYNKEEKLAQIAMQEKLAQINQTKELEEIRLKSSLEEKRLKAEQKNREDQLALDIKLAEAKNRLYLKLSLIAMGTLLLLMVAFFIYYYFKKRREDKLIAYNDNLEKYFRTKENETRLKIAEKILDTISSGKLSDSHEAKLIEVLNADHSNKPQREKPQEENLLKENLLENDGKEDDIEDAVIVEDDKQQ